MPFVKSMLTVLTLHDLHSGPFLVSHKQAFNNYMNTHLEPYASQLGECVRCFGHTNQHCSGFKYQKKIPRQFPFKYNVINEG